jgi:hypothetical protein
MTADQRIVYSPLAPFTMAGDTVGRIHVSALTRGSATRRQTVSIGKYREVDAGERLLVNGFSESRTFLTEYGWREQNEGEPGKITHRHC